MNTTIHTSKKKKRKVSARFAACAAGGALAVGSIIWGFSGPPSYNASAEQIVAELSPENIEQLKQIPPEQRHQMLESYGKTLGTEIASNFRNGPGRERAQREDKIRETLRSLDETDQQAFRNGMRQTMRQNFETQMSERISNFFKASPEEQERMLQEDIERMQKRRAEMEARRAEAEKNKAATGTEDKKPGEGRSGPPRNSSRENRENHMRDRLADSTPEERAQHQEYFRRLREKMNSQGATPPPPPAPAK